jgi:hypothetical protein
MHTPLVDLVSALSAEQSCLVCTEPYPSVDQRLCADCKRAMCPDCARLRPDTQWTCGECSAHRPVRAIVSKERVSSSPATVYARMRGLAASRLSPLASRVDQGFVATRGLLTRCVTFVLTFLAVLHGGLLELLSIPAPAAAFGPLRPNRPHSRLRSHALRVHASWERDRRALIEFAGESWESAIANARVRIAELVLSIRNVSLREQVAGILLGTAILIAVARSEGRDSRMRSR